MCVLEQYRKYGIGTQLFNEFKNVCKENHIEEIKVTASYDNINAINFYKKN
jgi:ribosomal protein S18 acetylase RimI-like enzyme